MSSKLSKLAASMPFAHYLGLSQSAARAEQDDDERKQREDESDDEYAKRMEKLDEDEGAARKAEEEKKEEEARKAEEKRKEDEAKKAKKAAEGDDDDEMKDDEEDEEEGKRAGRAKGARQRERVRCAAILAEGLRIGNIEQACAFACDTDMTAAQAVAVLKAGGSRSASRTTGLRERMGAATKDVPNPGPNSAAAAAPAKSLADRIVAAGDRARAKA